mgnify:CR=1 FL=1
MIDRETTAAFPNSMAERMVSAGYDIWMQEIDPSQLLNIPRRFVDKIFLKYEIVANYKGINPFFRGTLSGLKLTANDHICRSQFMKFVYKAVLRDCVKNIMAFNKVGTDKETVPFSHQVQKF